MVWLDSESSSSAVATHVYFLGLPNKTSVSDLHNNNVDPDQPFLKIMDPTIEENTNPVITT